MTNAEDAWKYHTGQLDALTLLVGALAAKLAPDAANAIFARCAELRAAVAPGAPPDAYSAGYFRTADIVADQLTIARSLQKMQSEPAPGSH